MVFMINKISNPTSKASLHKNKHCGERGSNTRPSDLQSDALPTELSPLTVKGYAKILITKKQLISRK
uniref:Uncharacterized protein n=1 Tax=Manihot esculenta TaxID=3983 RepID=A0A2C9W1U6_MANES